MIFFKTYKKVKVSIQGLSKWKLKKLEPFVRNSFVLHLIKSHPMVWQTFLFYWWLEFILKYRKKMLLFFRKNIKNFFRVFFFCFLGFELESASGSPYFYYCYVQTNIFLATVTQKNKKRTKLLANDIDWQISTLLSRKKHTNWCTDACKSLPRLLKISHSIWPKFWIEKNLNNICWIFV